MSNLNDLTTAIGNALDEDTPRLILADCLDENANPERAAFIRAQCEAARHPGYSAAHIASMYVARKLFTADIEALKQGNPKIIPIERRYSCIDAGALSRFHRGFEYKMVISDRSRYYNEAIEHVANNYPTVQYVYTQMGRGEHELNHLVASPLMHRLQGLYLHDNMQDDYAAVLRDFFADSRISNLQELSFRNYLLSANMLDNVAQNPANLQNIRTFTFNTGGDFGDRNQEINNPGYREFLLRLAGPEFSAHVHPQKLVLKDLHLSAEDWRTLLTSDFTKNLSVLELRGCDINPELLDIILHSARAKQLKSLSVTINSHVNFVHVLLAPQFSEVLLPELEHLDLSGKSHDFVCFGTEEIAGLLKNIDAPKLKNFTCTLPYDIRSNNVPDTRTAIKKILTESVAKKLPHLEVMNLTRAFIGPLDEYRGENTSKDTITRFALAKQLDEIHETAPKAFQNLTILNDTPVSEIDRSRAAQKQLCDPIRNER